MGKHINYSLTSDAVVNGCKFEAPREFDCGYDLYSNERMYIAPGNQVLVPTGLYLEIPIGTFGLIKDRSSMAMRQLHVNAGVVDSSFRGEVLVALENRSKEYQTVEKADRIAQMILLPYLTPLPVYNTELSDTERGEGGFGSTGK